MVGDLLPGCEAGRLVRGAWSAADTAAGRRTGLRLAEETRQCAHRLTDPAALLLQEGRYNGSDTLESLWMPPLEGESN